MGLCPIATALSRKERDWKDKFGSTTNLSQSGHSRNTGVFLRNTAGIFYSLVTPVVLHKRHLPIIKEMGRKRKKFGLADNGSEARSKEKKALLLWLLGLQHLTRCFLQSVTAHLRHILFDYYKDWANSSLHTLLEEAMNEIPEL